jgi:hypothetical protein
MTHRIQQRENRFLLGSEGNQDATRTQYQRGVLAPLFTWFGVRSTAARYSRAAEFRLLRSLLPTPWSRSYSAVSVGHISEVFYDEWQISHRCANPSGWFKDEQHDNQWFATIPFSTAQGHCAGSIKLFSISFDASTQVRNRVTRDSQTPTASTRFFTRATVSKETRREFKTLARSTSVGANQVEEMKLRRALRSLSRKKKGGRPRTKRRRNVNWLRARVANLRACLTWSRPVEYGYEARTRDVSNRLARLWFPILPWRFGLSAAI